LPGSGDFISVGALYETVVGMKAEVVVAIVGVAATLCAAFIQRPWQRKQTRKLPKHEAIEFGRIHEDGSFSVQDVVKILCLDAESTANGRSTAQYHDSYLLQRESKEGNGMVFRYGSSGGLSGGCMSHADRQVTSTYNSEHYPTSLAITVTMDQLAVGSRARVTNQLTFIGAFDRSGEEDFETHIERPTKSLAMIVKFSPARRCKLATGWFQVGERGQREDLRESGPVITEDGLLLYWRITPKDRDWLPIGARYQVIWTWEDAEAGQPVAQRDSA
jgi:hypothetical protein